MWVCTNQTLVWGPPGGGLALRRRLAILLRLLHVFKICEDYFFGFDTEQSLPFGCKKRTIPPELWSTRAGYIPTGSCVLDPKPC